MNLSSFLFIGALAGTLCGLLGSGGGIPLLLFLRHVYPSEPHRAFAISVSVMGGLAAVCLLFGDGREVLSLSATAPLIFPSIAGGVIGASLLGHVSASALRILFALICLVGGIRMLFW